MTYPIPSAARTLSRARNLSRLTERITMTTQPIPQVDSSTKTFPVPHYHVGKNIPGYLPGSDVWITDDWESAREGLLGELDAEFLTDDWDGPDRARWEELAAEWDESVIEVQALELGEGYGTILPLSLSDHDLGLSVWMEVCYEVCKDTDE